MKFRKKYAITLLEIMIVIVLIGLIGSVIGFNMKGSLDKGKAFKTEQAIEQVRDILQLELVKGTTTTQEIQSNPEKVLKKSGLVSNPDKMIKDGWNERLDIQINSKGEVIVSSKALDEYDAKQKE